MSGAFSVTPGLVRDTAATALTLLAILGLGVKFVLIPYLREHLVTPVEEVQRQVSDNHHATPDSPTLPDRLNDLSMEIRALARVMDVHMNWSEEQAALVERKIKALRKQAQRRQGDHGDR